MTTEGALLSMRWGLCSRALATTFHGVGAVFIESTHMASGGRYWSLAELDELRDLTLGRPIHLDGARLFNAEVASGMTAAAMAASSTTVMCCLSKGLCAPVGSLLAGPTDLIEQGIVERKRLGGAMRQAGVLAACGLIALEVMVERLQDDHRTSSSDRRGGG